MRKNHNKHFLSIKAYMALTIFLFLGGLIHAQTVTINDASFKAYLVSIVDASGGGNNDGEVQTSEAASITQLFYTDQGLTDPTGIEAFVNLTELYLYGNSITSINLSALTNLTTLDIHNNALTSLDISGCTNLSNLKVYQNSLSSLNLSNNTLITYLNADDNNFSTLDVSNITALENLILSQNPLTSIDLSSNTNLLSIYFYNTSLTALDLSNNTLLESVNLQGSNFTTIDLSENTELTYLNLISNGLTSIDLSSNTKLQELYLDDNSLSSVDLSNNTQLTLLRAQINNISSIDLSNNTSLQTLMLYSNNISTLNLSSNTALTTLNICCNNLTSLDVSSLTLLEYYKVNDNPLVSIDVSNLSNLSYFDARNCQLESVDLRNGNNGNINTSSFTVTGNSNLSCISVSDVTYATNNWTSIDAGLVFLTNCDTTAPEVSSLNPSDNATSVAVDSDLVLTFTEDVIGSPDGGFVRVKSVSSNTVVLSGRPTFETDLFTVEGNKMTIHLANANMPNPVLYETEYYVAIESNAIEDLNDNYFAGFLDNASWSFTTEAAPDLTAPTILSFDPVDGTTNVPFDQIFTVTFSEDIQVGTGVVGIRKVSDNSIVINGTPTADQQIFTVSGNTLTIDMGSYNTNPPVGGTEYYIEIFNNAVKDLSGNSFADGFNDNTTWNFTTAKEDQTITFNSLVPKTFGDASFDLFASSSSGLSVQYSSSNTSVATVSGSTVTIVGGGSTTITASQPGNSRYNAALSVEQSLVVNKASQSITLDPISDKVISDLDFDVTGAATSGLTLSYSIVSGPASITGSTISLDGTSGTVIVEANQSGNSNYLAAPSVTTSFNVTDPTKTDQTITFDPLTAKTFGDATFDLTATASSSLTVSYASSNTSVATVSGSTVTIVGAGSTTITASQAGDATFNPATAVQQVLTVNKADQTITIDPIDDKLITDAAFDVVASTTSNLTLGYAIISGPASISGTTITLTGTAGTVVVEVSQDGNSNYNSASEEISFEVLDQPAKQDQSITFGSLIEMTYGDASFELTAIASSGLAVSYSSSDENVATITGTTVNIIGAGSAIITASQEGDESFNAAIDVEQELIVNKASQIITFDNISDQFVEAGSVQLVASTSSGLPVEFAITNGPASLNGSTLNFEGIGSVTIEASQSGNENYLAATTVTQTFEIISVTGTEIIEIKQMTVYPNPASNQITISGLDDGLSQIVICDINGKQLKSIKSSLHESIDITDLVRGVYFIQINGSNQQTIRFIKK